ncbi:MAG: DegT/DnrJ/EryC1/StrS family aminotransferase [Planctomycetota bacterium]|nr:MAG: DegT/DnrJ/EryC1/StrS family aminotransferase [Planctomycetota bacterium]
MSQATLPLTSPPAPVPLIDLVEQFETQRSEVMEAVERVFTKQSFILGDEVSGLEDEIASYCDSRFAVGCASGTDALILALMALDVGPGDEVITSPFTFFATASSIVRMGARPVFVDIDPLTYNLCPEAVEAAVTTRTKAIMPVHLYGQCADMQPLWRVAVRHGISIIEDACQAIGAAYNSRRTGVLGTIGCFSFFPTKNLGGAGDGGMMTTDDPDLNARLRRLRVHGDVGRYEHIEVGFNSRLDALQAAVLRVKLKKLDEWSHGRQTNAARYDRSFEELGLPGHISAPYTQPGNTHVYNQYVVRVHEGRRGELMEHLKADRIGHAVYYPVPLHLQKCFAALGYQPGQFPESERACQEVLALPIYAELGEERQNRVIDSVARAFGVAAEPKVISLPMRRAA